MAYYNPNPISMYKQYGQSMMAAGGGSNMSGLGAKPSSSGRMSSRLDSKGFTPTASTSTASGAQYVQDYGDDSANIPMTPEQIYAAAAEASTQAGSIFTPEAPKANAMNLYSMPNMVESVSDYVYRADRNDAITSAIRSTQQEEKESVDAAIKSINKAITQGKTDAEIAETFLNDMGGFGSDKPDETGGFGVPSVEITDVTGTDAGAITNPQPLYDFAEEMANPSITTTELPSITPDQKEKLGAKLREASDKGDLSSVMNQLAQDSKVQLSSAVTKFIEDAETQVASNDIDPFTGQPIGNNELGFTDVSPAQEAPDQLGLMARPAASNDERQDPSYWDRVLFGGDETETPAEEPAVEAEAPAEVDDTTSYSMNNKKMKEEYVLGYLADLEGTQAHSSLEGGADTAAYGVKNSMGLDREDFKTDADFAAAVAFKHYNAAGKNFKETNRNIKVWSELGDKGRYAVTDLHYNVGTIGSTGKKSTPKAALENTLEFIGMTAKDGAKVSLMSLATRRAKNWNKAADSLGLTKIDKVQQIPTKKGTTFKYLDTDGNSIYTVNSGRRAVSLNSDGSYTVLTETRQEEL